jgi:hypothetical protein
MSAGQNSFINLYDGYRLAPSLRQGDRLVRRDHFRRIWLLAAAAGLLAAATVAEVLAAAKVAAVNGSIAGVVLAVAALALITGIVMSAADAGERASARFETQISLRRANAARPVPDPSERDVAEWVRRVEAALGQADPGPDPPGTS